MHEVFGQRLTFFVIRVQDVAISAGLDQACEVLDSEGMSSWNCYALYGADDILIRAWLTPDKQRALRFRLRDEKRWQVEQFECDQVDYVFAKSFSQPRRRDLVSDYADLIQRLNAKGHTRVEQDDAYLELKANGLVASVPSRASTSIKLYLLIKPQVRTEPGLTLLLREKLENSKVFDEPTLHTSIDGRYLIKATVQRYNDVLRGLTDLESQLRGFQLTSRTLLVAATQREENDLIREGTEPLTAELTLLGQTCGNEVTVLLTAARSAARTDLQEMYRTNVGAFSTAKRSNSPDLLNALNGTIIYHITGNGARFAQLSAAFWAAFEDVVPRACQVIVIRAAGANWYSDLGVKDALDSGGVADTTTRSPSITDATIGQLQRILDVFAKSDKRVANDLDKVLGTRWRTTLRHAADIRNAVQHGKLANGSVSFTSRPFAEWSADFLKCIDLFISGTNFLERNEENGEVA